MAALKVSILIATFGEDRWVDLAVSRALPSAKAQGDHGDHEILMLHGGPDQTLASVRNMLAESASGDWLCFLDADDELEPGYVDAMRLALHETMEEIEAESLASGHSWHPQPFLFVPAVRYVSPGSFQAAPCIPAWGKNLAEINCAVIGTLVPRPLFLQLGGFRDWPLYEDWDLWLRCVREGAVLVDVCDAVYRVNVSPASRNVSAVALDTYHAIRRDLGYE